MDYLKEMERQRLNMIEEFHANQQTSPSSSSTITTGSMNPNAFWCHICQKKFCSSSALFQHGKRLAHLKRAMKISLARCTTITNGKITSSIQRPNSISIPIPIVQPSPPPPAPAPSSTSSCTSSSLESIQPSEPMIIHKHYHVEKKKTSYTCQLCNCRCWSIRNIHRHLRLHADVRPFHCNRCQMKFKSYANLFKHFKTSRHQANEDGDDKQWTVNSEALEEQKKLISQAQFIEDPEQPQTEVQENETTEKETSSIADSDNLLEDLHIPDSRLLDGDAAELALIDPNTFEELHKAAECLLNLQGLFYFGEEEHGAERSNPFSAS